MMHGQKNVKLYVIGVLSKLMWRLTNKTGQLMENAKS